MSYLLIFCGLAALILLLSVIRTKAKHPLGAPFSHTLLAAAGAMFAGFAAVFLNGRGEDGPGTILRILAACLFYLTLFLYSRYVASSVCLVSEKKPSPAAGFLALPFCAASAVLLILSERIGMIRNPQGTAAYQSPFFWLLHIGELVLLIVVLLILQKGGKGLSARSRATLLSLPVLVVLATALLPLTGPADLRYPALLLGLLIVYTGHHAEMEHFGQVSAADLQSRLVLVSGRMKPHYIYNVLTSIYYLCETDPEQAQDAISAFSEYLRNTLETIEDPGMVPFPRELNQIRSYLHLEKMRFEDRLKVSYDVDVDDFEIPPLTVLPLVENAVKHGIRGLEGPGTVRIVTRRLPDNKVQIRIIDDGIGFDLQKITETSHRGLAAIRDRIEKEAGGEMTIDSTPGKGTTVVLTIDGNIVK